MRIDRRTVLLVLVLLLATLVAYLALRNPPPSALPHDADHAVFVSIEACVSCHGADGVAPQGPNHPISQQCLSCHSR